MSKSTDFKADTTLANTKELIDKLTEAGWKYGNYHVSKPRKDHAPETVVIFQREIDNPKFTVNSINQTRQKEAFFVTDSKSVTKQGLKNAELSRDYDGGKTVYGQAKESVAPLHVSLAFSDILSVNRMRQEGSALVLALDTEFYYLDDGSRLVLTWQIAFVEPDKPDRLQQVLFASTRGERLSVGFMLSWLIQHYDFSDIAPDDFGAFDYRNTRRYVYHTVNNDDSVVTHVTVSLFDAIANSTLDGERAVLEKCLICEHKALPNAVSENGRKYVDNKSIVDGYINDFREYNRFALPVVLLCHAGKADLTTFNHHGCEDFMPRLSDVQGGLVALSDFYLHTPCIEQYWKFFPISLTVRDSMCFAPAGMKTLASLGKTVAIPKLDVSAEDKNNMLAYMLREPVAFAEYAINDSVIALCYAGELWGYNTLMPVTVSGAAVKAAVPVISEYLGIDYNNSKQAREEYNIAFRGLHTVKKGLSVMKDKAAFIANTALEPLNDKCRILQDYARLAYKGGYNGSVVIGKYDGIETHDFDLENAYPTCMALVPDVNWRGAVIANEIVNRPIYRQDFHSPFDLMFGYIKFRFPDNVNFPCIPVAVDGCMVFPRSSDGLDGVYASAPEIYLALCLGAEVIAEHVYVGEYLYNSDGTVSRSLLSAVKQLVNDRNLAQQSFGKKSLPDLLLKTAVNSLYGKTAQDLIDKSTWNAFRERMDDIGGSALTSPTHACLTTAGVRCVLLAAMNQLHELGYQTYSVTTDGFISNAPEDVLNSLDLYGFSAYFRSAREALVGSREMWAEKHHQSDLLNFTTRGNVSLSEHGVCAHNSFVTGFEKDSFEDRLALMTAVLSRIGSCSCTNKIWVKFRQLSSRSARADFGVADKTRNLSMDFDLKRKPLKSSIVSVFPVVEGVQFEIANFDTVPYDTVDEYRRYKSTGKSCNVLRTEKDWSLFFAKVERSNPNGKGGGCHIKDLDWSILFTCIMGYRLGLWDIPYLNTEGLSVADKIEWINKFNKSKKKFSENTWKDCRKATRQSQMLDRVLVEDMLTHMQNWITE